MPTPHRDSQGYYRALGLQPDATQEQIQLAYEALGERPPAERHATMSAIERAYSVLKSPEARRIYDRMEMAAPRPARWKLDLNLNNPRLLAACLMVFLAIMGFVWVPLYGSRFRSFSAGDRLVDLKGAPFGVVVQTEERHLFSGGFSAPAYLVELASSKELRWYPAADIQYVCRRAD